MNSKFREFARKMRHPLYFRIFLFTKLPNALFAGLRVRSFSDAAAEISISYGWFNRNPFRSTYFASLSMAAEMSTGALAMGHVLSQDQPMSLLVVKTEGEYLKKATGLTIFRCEDGKEIEASVKQAMNGEPVTFRARSVGRDLQGEEVAIFHITWSFRLKKISS